MSKTYKKCDATYDKASKTLYINQSRDEFVPSYAYYACEYMESKVEGPIEYVVFNDDLTQYPRTALKSKYDWKEVQVCNKD